jgi:hypothetical protein
MSEESDSEDLYESGSYCRHYHELGDCDEPCGTCGHWCRQHASFDDGECLLNGCSCEAFTECKDYDAK